MIDADYVVYVQPVTPLRLQHITREATFTRHTVRSVNGKRELDRSGGNRLPRKYSMNTRENMWYKTRQLVYLANSVDLQWFPGNTKRNTHAPYNRGHEGNTPHEEL